MLHCPRCSNPLTVFEPTQDLPPHNSQCGGLSTLQFPPKFPPPPRPPPQYQNVGPPTPPRVPIHPPPSPAVTPEMMSSPTLLLHQKDAALQAEVLSIQISLLEKQLEQSRLQQEILTTYANPQPSSGMLCSPPWFLPSSALPLSLPSSELSHLLTSAQRELDQCGWYYGPLSWQESVLLLQDSPQGTFLVRDSSSSASSSYKYSLSVQRRPSWCCVGGRRGEGPTSVRIQFTNGKFRLDSDDKIRSLMPQFDSVGALVSHYIGASGKVKKRMMFEEEKPVNSEVTGLVLSSPLLKTPPSLAHMSRLAIHRAMADSQPRPSHQSDRRTHLKQLELPAKLMDFLEAYPLSI